MTKQIVKKYIAQDTLSYYNSCLEFSGYGTYHRREFRENIRFFLNIELLYYYRISKLSMYDILYKEYLIKEKRNND